MPETDTAAQTTIVDNLYVLTLIPFQLTQSIMMLDSPTVIHVWVRHRETVEHSKGYCDIGEMLEM